MKTTRYEDMPFHYVVVDEDGQKRHLAHEKTYRCLCNDEMHFGALDRNAPHLFCEDCMRIAQEQVSCTQACLDKMSVFNKTLEE